MDSIGTLTIEGTFLDKRGQCWKRFEVKLQETVVLVGTANLSDRAHMIYSKDLQFTYWEGDKDRRGSSGQEARGKSRGLK